MVMKKSLGTPPTLQDTRNSISHPETAPVKLDRRTLRVGQRYRVGRAVIELTKMRSPCSTLNLYPGIQSAIFDAAVKAGDPSSPRWGLSGFYASVVTPGPIRTGDPIVFLDQAV